MRWQFPRKAWAALALGLVSACTTTGSGAQTVVQRMAEEYNCNQDMAVTTYSAGGYRVEGCGYTANYDCTYGRGATFTCVKEAGSSPVPASVPPPPVQDAGPR